MTTPLPPELATRLRASFVTEARQRLQALEGCVLELEEHAASTTVNEAFRHAHTIKGAAATVGIDDAADLAHDLESTLEELREDPRVLTRAQVDALLEAVDHLRAIVDAAEDTEPPATATGADGATPAPPHLSPADGLAAEAAPPWPTAEMPPLTARSGGAVDLLDALVTDIAELAIESSRLGAVVRNLERAARRLGETELRDLIQQLLGASHEAARLVAHAQDEIRGLRLTPASAAFAEIPRAARDLARSLGKDVRVQITGGETTADRQTVDLLRIPLLHLVRNAVDHGIEAPAERAAAGKPPTGTVTVEAATEGTWLRVAVRDDGQGVNTARVLAAARARGIVTGPDAGEQEALRCILAPGFSTRRDVDDVSGRGVGLDVVRTEVETHGGTVDVATKRGAGAAFTIRVPLSVTGTRCLIMRVGERSAALPVAVVHRVVDLRGCPVGSLGGGPIVEVDGEALPSVDLRSVLDAPGPDGARRAGVVVGGAAGRVLLLADALEPQEELLVHPLPDVVGRIDRVTGAAVRADGTIVPVLAVSAVVGFQPAPAITEEAPTPRRPRVLIAEDSITTRALERAILESVGYDVVTCGDGAEALAALQTQDVDVLVSDIQMPGLDGFALTERVRGHPQLHMLPVVLVTSLDSRSDRERAILAGADAYIAKSDFDEGDLVATIQRLLA